MKPDDEDFDTLQNSFDKKLDRERQSKLKNRRKNIKARYTKYFVNLLRLAAKNIWVELNFKNEKQHKVRKKIHPRRRD